MANIAAYAGDKLPTASQQAEQYVEYVEGREHSLRDVFEILYRRRVAVAVTSGALALLSLLIALLWPPTYRAPATVLVQDQEIPQDLVRPTVNSLVDERIQVISQQVMTRTVLLGIVEKYNLYESQRRTETNEEIIDRMRKDIKLTTISSDSNSKNRSDDRRRQGTIAFQISYDSATPIAAQRVTNELVSLYLNENLRTRQQRAAETSLFLADEAEKLAAYISEMEAKLSDFKARNLGRLPQNSQFNVNVIDRLEQEIIRIDQNINSAEEKRQVTMTQLAQVKDMVPATPPIPAAALERGAVFEPPERLRYLQSQLASLQGNYSEDHPDVRRVKREIASIEREVGGVESIRPSADSLELARTKLQMLRDKYSDDHPDVVRQRREVSALEAASQRVPAAIAPKPSVLSTETRAETQLKITLQGQLKGMEGELKSLRNAKRELQTKLALLERRVEQAPVVEKTYQDLLRDYDNATLRYREIKAKQMQATVAESLEKESKGERFTLIDPPELPEKAAKPHRKLLLAVGFLLALGSGLGMGFLREAIDRSIHGSRQLVRLVHAPVLEAIPYVQTERERSYERRVHWGALAFGAFCIIMALGYVHFFVTPLEVLWFVFARRVGIE